MTRQEIFDFTTRAIIAQGGPSFDPESGRCPFRGPNGRKCATGHLIPDERYDPSVERWCDVNVKLEPGLLKHREFLSSIQDSHDTAAMVVDGSDIAFWPAWRDRLHKLADAHALDPSVLSEIPDGETPA